MVWEEVGIFSFPISTLPSFLLLTTHKAVIDHSFQASFALSIKDDSHSFYRQVLGFQLVG